MTLVVSVTGTQLLSRRFEETSFMFRSKTSVWSCLALIRILFCLHIVVLVQYSRHSGAMGKTTSKTKSYSVWGRYWSSVQYFFSFLISLWFINKNIYTNKKKIVEDFKQNLHLHGVGGGYRLDEWSMIVTLRKIITILLVWPWVLFCRVYTFFLVWVFGKSSFIPPSKIKLAKW